MSKRVLVIDDDDDVRLLIRRTLETKGYEVEEISSGEGLEAAICAFPPDLILSDVLMPGVDGLSLCRRLQEDPQTRHIPVVLVSAKSFASDKRF